MAIGIRRTTPELHGTLKDISANALQNGQTGQSFYRVRINVTEQELGKLAGLSLFFGMPFEALIKTLECTALNCLVTPLQERINRAIHNV